jgi:hypothetical protein
MRERGGDAGEWRASWPGVAKHLDDAAVAEVERLPAADDHRDHREEVAKEGEVAHHQCAPVKHEEALVHAGALTAASGEQNADVDVEGMRSIHHGEVSLPLRRVREEDTLGAHARTYSHATPSLHEQAAARLAAIVDCAG